MPDLATRIREYYDASAEPVGAEEIFSRLDGTLAPRAPVRRPLLVALGAAAVVLIAIGAVVVLGLMRDAAPVVDEPTTTVPQVTTTAPTVTTTLDSAPTSLPPTTVAPPPEAAGETWGMAGTAFSEWTWIADVTATPAGLIAVGADEGPWPIEAAVWTSTDGSEWARSSWTDTGLMTSVATVGTTTIAVGYDYVELPLDWLEDRQAIWVSDGDPASWERLVLDSESFGAGWIWRVAPGGPGLLAAGRTCVGEITDPEQQQAGLLADCSVQPMTVWGSADGRSWDVLWVDEPSPAVAGIYDIETVGSGFVVAGSWIESWPESEGSESAAVLWVSVDGTEWTRLIIDDQPIEPENTQLVATGVAVTDAGFVAVGWESNDNGMERLARVWTSPDGVTWTRVTDLPDPNEVRLWDLTPADGRLITVGSVRSGGEPAEVTPIAWWSSDGLTWIAGQVPGDGSMRSAAATPVGVIGVGVGFMGESGEIWITPPR